MVASITFLTTAIPFHSIHNVFPRESCKGRTDGGECFSPLLWVGKFGLESIFFQTKRWINSMGALCGDMIWARYDMGILPLSALMVRGTSLPVLR